MSLPSFPSRSSDKIVTVRCAMFFLPEKHFRGKSTWIATLLEALPDHVPPEARDRLSIALIPLFGADAVIWSTDIAGVDRETALDVMAWMAAALDQAALNEAPDDTPSAWRWLRPDDNRRPS